MNLYQSILRVYYTRDFRQQLVPHRLELLHPVTSSTNGDGPVKGQLSKKHTLVHRKPPCVYHSCQCTSTGAGDGRAANARKSRTVRLLGRPRLDELISYGQAYLGQMPYLHLWSLGT